MKTLILVFAVVLTTLGTSCSGSRYVQGHATIIAIDSISTVYEDMSNPGVFVKVYDTVKIDVVYKGKYGPSKISYKIKKD